MIRKFTDSDIYIKMNTGNAIYRQLSLAVKSITEKNILNNKLSDSLDSIQRAYKDGITLLAIQGIKNLDIIIVYLPIDKRFPANMPYIKTKRRGKDCVIVDMSKYASVQVDDSGNIISATCDYNKLYNLVIPAFIALKVLDGNVTISTETSKWLAYLWAKLFNKILMAQKIYVGNPERYEAFMYFAMRFFLVYYLGTNMAIVDKISSDILNGTKSKYILMIEDVIARKKIDLYKDWTTFAYTMFSDEITNIHSSSNIEMNAEQYLRLYSMSMGKDGSYLALWSADYFLYCIFVTYNRVYILNDRAWNSIVYDNPKIVPKILNGLYTEI